MGGSLNFRCHEVFVTRLCSVATFANRPNDQRLTAATITSSKDARNTCFKVGHIGRDVRTLISLQTKTFNEVRTWPQEAQRQKD